jgi:hypothetical protein
MFDGDKKGYCMGLGEKSLSGWVSITAERVNVFVGVSEKVFH